VCRAVEPIEMAGMTAAVLLVVPFVAHRWSSGGRLRNTGPQLAIGIIPGVVGAAIALLPRLDLVRDSFEVVVLPFLGVAVAVLAFFVVMRLGRAQPEHDG
jgi:hypothetical protein